MELNQDLLEKNQASLVIGFDQIDNYFKENEIGIETLASIKDIKTWLYDRLCHDHPDLGRHGQVCPYSKHSIREKLFWFCPYLKADTTPEQICEYMLQLMKIFIDSRIDSKEEIFRTYVVVFPRINSDQTTLLIDNTHSILKPNFISKGLMLGQFHQNCAIGGIHNPKFMALYTPIPLFVIRNIVLNDYMFLRENKMYMYQYTKFCSERYGDEFFELYDKIYKHV